MSSVSEYIYHKCSLTLPQAHVRSMEHHTDWVNDITLCGDGRYSEFDELVSVAVVT